MVGRAITSKIITSKISTKIHSNDHHSNDHRQGLAQTLAAQGEIAEQLGFDAFWLPESHFSGVTAIPSPLMLLASVAGRTTRLKLGSTSYLLPIRHPILAAEEVAVLDQLSGGRVILGIGRGFQENMFKTFNIPVKEKRERFNANLKTMISAWKGEPIACEETGHNNEDKCIRLSPLPVQRPHPPLWVAAFGPLAIKQAGILGLPYIASPVEDLAGLRTNYAAHQAHIKEAGHDPVTVIPVMRTVFITRRAALAESVRQSLQEEARHRGRAHNIAVENWAIVGDAALVKDKLAEYQESIGLNYLIARGRIKGIEGAEQVRSHEQLAALA